MPKAVIGEDGQLYKSCPQCIDDEMSIYGIERKEAEQRTLVLADEHFCANKRTADGYQSWCKKHIQENNRKNYKKTSPKEREAKQDRLLENAQRSQKYLRAEQQRVLDQIAARQEQEETEEVTTDAHN